MADKLFTYFGNKQRVSKIVWPLFGETKVYSEPFCGCASTLLSSPYSHTFECINDKESYIANAFRAVKYHPEEVKKHLYNPRCEIDLHARHDYLVSNKSRFTKEMMRGDPKFCDPELAAWWIWGINLWLYGRWCSTNHTVKTLGTKLKKPTSGNKGVLRTESTKPTSSNKGVLRTISTKPTSDNKGVLNKGDRKDIIDRMVQDVFDRLVDVTILCGDFERCLTTSYTTKIGTSAVFLDPPYVCRSDVYETVDDDGSTFNRAKEWFINHMDDPMYRIILCGEDRFWEDCPEDVHKIFWYRGAGYAADKSIRQEVLWVSKHCLIPNTIITNDIVSEDIFV